MDAVTLYATWPNLEAAETAARQLVERRIAACVNLLPNVVSVYRWEGALQRDSEVVMLVKTTAARAAEARDAIVALHPNQLPCVTAFRIDSACASAPFLNWLQQETL
ncbi:MAG TPA: divalent-cation tolerance protein CutA [Caulobacterales bacterium]|nr:divalent-cation tolerance protein CutA [Caulobacterales bacterium]